jgi:hypothetical protein
MNDTIAPSAANLIFPENNTICNEGTIISETETEVLFEWQEAEHTSSYVLQVVNLNDGSSRNINTPSTEFLLRVMRGTPYSWSVKSISGNSNETAESSVWSFYNAGLATESHAPFPATLISPQSGSSVDQGSILLEWEAFDLDNDISDFTVYLDTSNPPETIIGTTSISNMEVSVVSGAVYYWKIRITDATENTSTSQVFQFLVN